MYKITKEFNFCYGHRVWSQILNSDYSLDPCLKCRHLHGHQGLIKISLQAENLSHGMVTDFKHLNWFKKWLDDTLDHKFIMDINDPIFDHEIETPIMDMMANFRDLNFKETGLIKHAWGYYVIDPTWYEDLIEPVREKYEGMVFVDFVPTSENLSKWIFDIVQEKMSKINIQVEGVVFYETPKSQSEYHI